MPQLAFHDISAANYSKMAPFLDFIRKLGWQNIDLVVIPACDEQEKKLFGTWLLHEKSMGSKLWLHGHKHKADEKNNASLKGRWVQKVVNYEAEFYGLNPKESRIRLEAAFESWNELNVGRAEGFVPPTWHCDSWVKRYCLESGLAFESRFWTEYPTEEKFWSLPISFPTGNLWETSLKVGSALYKSIIPTRIVLHPVDLEGERKLLLKEWLEELAER